MVARVFAEEWRARFFVRTWGYGLLFGLAFGVMASRQKLWWLVAAHSYLIAIGLSTLVLLRLSGRLNELTHLSLVLVTPFLALAGLLQNPPNPISPVFLVLVPLLAGFLLSQRALWFWLVVAIAFGATSEWAIANGYHLQGPIRPHHGVIVGLNLAALVLLVVSFVRWFDNMRRDTLSRLEAASKARTIFLANVSHEIRTPMNGVLGLTELILAGRLDDDQREKIELVQRSGHSLVTLIDDLLLITRAESGRLVLSAGPTGVAKVIADVVELFAPVATQKGLSLRANVGPEVPPSVELDGVRWRQVLTNLVSNAVKFTQQGAVEVRLMAQGERLVLSVTDTGVGIHPEVMARLFQPFEQGDDSTTRRYGGSGLGLALSRQLVEVMGGSISVTSQAGVCTTFTVDVPLVASAAALANQPPVAPHPRRSGLPVLVVDDNPVNLLVARGLVERAGYDVRVARNGREALEAVSRERFALILMDCQMPEMDGLEATRQIRLSAFSQTPIVALTASGLPEELDACRQAGMDDCLVKPVSLEMVKRALMLAR